MLFYKPKLVNIFYLKPSFKVLKFGQSFLLTFQQISRWNAILYDVLRYGQLCVISFYKEQLALEPTIVKYVNSLQQLKKVLFT